MTWAKANTPEDVFGYRDKPFRLTGEASSYFDTLNAHELTDLSMITKILRIAAELEGSAVHILLVGSAAASATHGDIDLLACSSPNKNRVLVANQALEQFQNYPFKVENHPRKGSVDTFASSLFLSTKIFALSQAFWNTFDISFAGASSGDWGDILSFHQRTRRNSLKTFTTYTSPYSHLVQNSHVVQCSLCDTISRKCAN